MFFSLCDFLEMLYRQDAKERKEFIHTLSFLAKLCGFATLRYSQISIYIPV